MVFRLFPKARMSPPSHFRLPIISRRRVDFPEPEPPRITSVSPRITSRRMASRTPRPSKVLLASMTWMTGSDMASPTQEIKDRREEQIDRDHRNNGEHDGARGGNADALRAAGHAQAKPACQGADEQAEHPGLGQSRDEIPELQGIEAVMEILDGAGAEKEVGNRHPADPAGQIADHADADHHDGRRQDARHNQEPDGVDRLGFKGLDFL